MKWLDLDKKMKNTETVQFQWHNLMNKEYKHLREDW